MMNIRKKFGVITALLLLLVATSPAFAQIVHSGNMTVDFSTGQRLNPEQKKSLIYETDQEMLINRGFETGSLNPWYTDSLWIVTTDSPYSGTYCARSGNNYWIRQDFAPTPASQIVSITFWELQPLAQITAVDIMYQDGSYTENLVWPGSVWEQFNVTSWIQPGQTVTGIRIWGFWSSLPPPWYTYIDELSVQTVGGGSNWDINTSAVNPPVVIPANGGSFPYNINVHNLTTTPQSGTIWNKVRNRANQYTVVFGPVTRTLAGGANPTRILTQNLAGSISSGTLYFISYIGTYPSTVVDSSFFTITKSTVADGNPWIGESFVTGDVFDEYATVATLPDELSLSQTYPNPFNPTTTIRFELPSANHVKLSVYDVSGKKVAELVNGMRDAGSHEVTFDGSGLVSGVYLYKLEAGSHTAGGKMVLLK